MSNTELSRTKPPANPSKKDTPASKMKALKRMRSVNPTFKSQPDYPSLSYIDKSADEGPLFPGSPNIEGDPNSAYDFQKRRIVPKLLLNKSSFEPTHKSQQVIQVGRLGRAEGNGGFSSARNRKFLYCDMNKIFKTTAEEEVEADEELMVDQDSILEEQLSSLAEVNRGSISSYSGFSMRGKMRRIESISPKQVAEGGEARLDEGVDGSYVPMYNPDLCSESISGELKNKTKKSQFQMTTNGLRNRLANASKSSSIDDIMSQLLKFK